MTEIARVFPEKDFVEAQHPFIIKVLKILDTEGIYLNIIKAIYMTNL